MESTGVPFDAKLELSENVPKEAPGFAVLPELAAELPEVPFGDSTEVREDVLHQCNPGSRMTHDSIGVSFKPSVPTYARPPRAGTLPFSVGLYSSRRLPQFIPGARARVTVSEGANPLVPGMEFTGSVVRPAPDRGEYRHVGVVIEITESSSDGFKGYTIFATPRYEEMPLDRPDEEGIVIVNMALRDPVSALVARGIASLEIFPATKR